MLDGDTLEQALRIATGAGIGLLIGAERERRMSQRGRRGPAGVRTFALAGLLGGLAEQIGGTPIIVVAFAFVGAAALLGYFREPTDVGITTEVALVVTFLLGVLAQREPTLASGIAVGVTILLATRSALHRFVSSVLTEEEVHDALLLAAAALVVLPLLPNENIGPFGVLNPFWVWRLVVALMALSSAGYVMMRAVGLRYGLVVAGLLGGFVSSTATIGAMGGHAREQPTVRRAAVAGAMASTVSTVVQMGVVLAAVSPGTLRELTWPLVLAGLGAAAMAGYGVFGTRAPSSSEAFSYGRAFELRSALLLAVVITAVTLVSAAASEIAGDRGVLLAALVGGVADTHAAAIGVASLVAAGKLPASAATLAVLGALSTNTGSKVVFAFIGGGPRFAVPVVAGLGVVLVLAWLGALLPSV